MLIRVFLLSFSEKMELDTTASFNVTDEFIVCDQCHHPQHAVTESPTYEHQRRLSIIESPTNQRPLVGFHSTSTPKRLYPENHQKPAPYNSIYDDLESSEEFLLDTSATTSTRSLSLCETCETHSLDYDDIVDGIASLHSSCSSSMDSSLSWPTLSTTSDLASSCVSSSPPSPVPVLQPHLTSDSAFNSLSEEDWTQISEADLTNVTALSGDYELIEPQMSPRSERLSSGTNAANSQ